MQKGRDVQEKVEGDKLCTKDEGEAELEGECDRQADETDERSMWSKESKDCI